MKRWLPVVLAAAFTAIFLFSGMMLRQNGQEQAEAERAFSAVAELIQTEPEIVVTESAPIVQEPIPPSVQYASVYAANSDFVGWISIEGTSINYPVMQTPDRPNYYLRRGFDRESSKHGVPYLQEDCGIVSSENLIIYGHHMNDGTMFADLCRYQSKTFWEEHPLIHFDTMQEFGVYEIVAVFRTVVYSPDGFRYFDFAELDDKERFDSYINQCAALALYDIGVESQYGDQLLTLSTCEYSHENGRMVVVARKVEPDA